MGEGITYLEDAEAAVLGICLLEKSAFGRTYGLIDENCFYFKDNQIIYSCLKEMNGNGIPIDIITVCERMAEKKAELSGKNCAWYLARLTSFVVSSFHLEYHCLLLKKMFRRRELEKLTHSGIDLYADEKEQAYKLSDKISNILGNEVKQDWYSMDELMFNLLMHQEEIRRGNKVFITTGFKAIDKLNEGFSPGQLIVIGARPAVGKSALAGLMAIAMSKEKKVVGMISLEMNNTEIASRLASVDSDIEFSKIHRNLFVDENQHRKFYDFITKNTINHSIYVSDKTKVDINEIKAKASKLKFRHGLDVLIVDYLQLIDTIGGNKNYNREQEVAKISRGLKLLAMDLQIPVIVLCQLNRSVTARKAKDRYPQLSDLRESGAIEQDADVVLMLHRDWMSGYEIHPETGESTQNKADILGVKWRNGAPFHLEIDFDPQKMKFMEKSRSTFGHMNQQIMTNENNDDITF